MERQPSHDGLPDEGPVRGHLSAPPAFIEDMYVTSIRGRTGADVLKVAPSKCSAGDVGQSEW
ncbi:hypothetical protein JRI60_17820 [Archangium violaceum]|nr:hypothetical protein [Archangium violaceum]QRO00751.1 hypothetical protein JRI60_17820 [Archangium violaceum]